MRVATRRRQSLKIPCASNSTPGATRRPGRLPMQRPRKKRTDVAPIKVMGAAAAQAKRHIQKHVLIPFCRTMITKKPFLASHSKRRRRVKSHHHTLSLQCLDHGGIKLSLPWPALALSSPPTGLPLVPSFSPLTGRSKAGLRRCSACRAATPPSPSPSHSVRFRPSTKGPVRAEGAAPHWRHPGSRW